MSNYKILVTSRYGLSGFDVEYQLESLNDEDAMRLLRNSARLTGSLIPENLQREVIFGLECTSCTCLVITRKRSKASIHMREYIHYFGYHFNWQIVIFIHIHIYLNQTLYKNTEAYW